MSASQADLATPLRAASSLELELQALCDAWLAPHIARIESGATQPRPKVINDALWGTIRLYPWEVALLDSYLLQRLRFLRQLGVVHWVYPSAGHSRLEHSLGVLHQMQALLDGLERNSGRAGDRVVDDVTGKLLRIAALVHDCGHCAMSHVPESFMKNLPGVEELRADVWNEYRPREDISVSEAFAVTFVRSKSFARLLSLPAVGADFIVNIEDAARKIAAFIVGGPVDARHTFASQLINGSFDADKLDYMPRDCLMAGVPCAVDVQRVVETVRCVEVPATAFPDHAKWAGVPPDGTVRILTLSSSGSRALDELSMTRTILFDKVYYHHKVRVLEVMVRRALPLLKKKTVSDWLSLVDDDLLAGEASAAFSHIRSRRLLKRAITINAPESDDLVVQKAWRRLTLKSGLDAFRQAVTTRTAAILAALQLSGSSLDEHPIEVDVPDVKKIELDMNCFIGDSVAELTSASPVQSGQRPEAGKQVARERLYVFAPEEAILATFLAARQELQEHYGLPTGAEAYRATRLDPEAIVAADAKLVAAGYYTQPPPDMGPGRIVTHRISALESFLKTAWPRLEVLSGRFGPYQSPGSSPITPATIAAFLRQFRTDALARSQLRVLEDIDFKNRAFFALALASRLKAALEIGEVDAVCPFGQTGDSSALLGYLMNDVVPPELRRKVMPLELALEGKGSGAILLWDDFCGQAGHSKTALAQWLGIKTDGLLKEHHVDELSEQRLRDLKGRHILVAFALARNSGLVELRRFVEAAALPFQILDAHESVPETHDAFSSARVLSDKQSREALDLFSRTVANTILRPNLTRPKDPWSEQDLNSRLLGYGNGGNLLVFFYNVPTITLTTLWLRGSEEQPWIPLFPRRQKPSA